jgi:hypothetical protein
MDEEIDLNNPNLGRMVLNDPKGELPAEVFHAYVWEHAKRWRPVLTWLVDPTVPDNPINPQLLLQEAYSTASRIPLHLRPNPTQPARIDDAFALALKVQGLLLRLLFESESRISRRGQPPTIRPIAVRAWVIRKFNPDPKKPGESTVKWASLADMLFRKNGKCAHCIKDEVDGKRRPCGLPKHQYNSQCVKALQTAVNHLVHAMKNEGIPT